MCFTHYYHPAIILFPAPQLKILYETLCILYPAIIDAYRLPKEINTAHQIVAAEKQAVKKIAAMASDRRNTVL